VKAARRARALVAWAVVASSASHAGAALADEPVAPVRAGPRVVTLSVDGAAEDAELYAFTIRELLGRIDVRVSTGADTEGARVVAHVRVDANAPGGVAVRVTDARGRPVLTRTVARDPSPAITREGVAHAVQTAVESTLLDDGPPEPPPPVKPPPKSPPPAAETVAPAEAPPARERQAPSAPPRYALDLATFVGGGPVASGAGVAPRVGGWVTGRAEGALRPSVTLSGAYAFPFESGDELVTARASLTALRAFAAIELVRGADVSLEAGLGGGVDVLSVSPRSDVLPSSVLRGATTRVDGIVSGLLTARLAVFRGASLMLSAGADGDVSTRDYVVEQGAARTTLLAPWRVRPVVLVGLSFTALGAPRFDVGGAP
jgi:hypothetical protein